MAPPFLRDPRFLPLLILLALLIGTTANALVLLPTLPDPMPTHFDSSGAPNGWSSPGSFIGIWLGVAWGIGVVFGLLALLPKVPRGCVNLPSRDVLERSGRLPAVLRKVSALLIVNGCLIVAVIWVIFALSAAAAVAVPPMLPAASVIVPVVVLIAAEIAVIVGIFWIVNEETKKVKGPGLL